MVDYYDGEIRFLDHYVGQTLEWLQASGQLDNTLVVVTADHGEELTEHGLIGHGWSVYDWELHVPFVLYHPVHFAGGQRVSEPVQTVDLFPTILELLGLDRTTVANHLLGRSLQPERVQADPRPFTISERLAPSLRRFERVLPNFDVTPLDRQLRALRLRGPGHKLVWGSDGRHELYDLAKDPGEMENLADRDPERLQMLLDELQTWLDGLDAVSFDQLEQEMDETLAQRLRDLGYI
jgi:arylsulfatase A-like enzyme